MMQTTATTITTKVTPIMMLLTSLGRAQRYNNIAKELRFCPFHINCNFWTCCGAPLWFQHWMTVLVGFVVILVLLEAITASITSHQYDVDIPDLGYDRNSFTAAPLSNEVSSLSVPVWQAFSQDMLCHLLAWKGYKF
jgi:hypothetical protein